MNAPRVTSGWLWTGDAQELSAAERYCTHCHKPLKRGIVWLETDCRDGSPHNGGVPVEHSQGWFPYGVTCAGKLVTP